MPDNSPLTTRPTTRIAILWSLLVGMVMGACAIGGFLLGRTNRDNYLRDVNNLIAHDIRVHTLYEALGDKLADAATADGFAKMYGVPAGDRVALAARLRGVIWAPPARPEPFVGHMARPYNGEGLYINELGFRDRRESYMPKPERTVRIFITGGSTAFGSGASSNEQTTASHLERLLSERSSDGSRVRYQVINTAFPAWSTTQEKLLIQQSLVDLQPDFVIMFSGTNDVFWSILKRDIRWFYGFPDQNYMTLLNNMYRASGHADGTFSLPIKDRRPSCAEVGRLTARNVEEAAFAVARVGARLIFALQPNVVSTAKALTSREQRMLQDKDREYWDSCYESVRASLSQISARDFRWLDLSYSFGNLASSTELFIDFSHFSDQGNHIIAESLANAIDLSEVKPGRAAGAGDASPSR